MSRSELVRRSGVSKQQLSRLENGLIRLRLDHLKPFANALGYSPEQVLLWGRYPGTSENEVQGEVLPPSEHVPELAARSEADHAELNKRKDGRHLDRIRSEGWFRPWVQSHSAIHVTRLAAELIGPTEQLVGKHLPR